MKELVKFSSQVDKKLLLTLKAIASKQGRRLQDVLDEAMRDYVEKENSGKARKQVIEAFSDSVLKYGSVYKKLAE